MKMVKIIVSTIILLGINFVSWSEPWYCKVCCTIHDSVCPEVLFDGFSYDLSSRQIDEIGVVQADMEDLNSRSRLIVICELMYRHRFSLRGRLVRIKDRNIMDWGELNGFFDHLQKCLLAKLRRSELRSSFRGIAVDFQKLEEYLSTMPLLETFDIFEFREKIERYVKDIIQKCSWKDLSLIKGGLEKYKGSNSDAVRIVWAMEKALNIENRYKKKKVDCGEMTNFLEFVKKTVASELLLFDAKTIALFHGPRVDENDSQEIFDLMIFDKDPDFQRELEKILGNIETFLSSAEKISITLLVKKFIERYTFSYRGLGICRYLARFMEMGWEKGLTVEECLKQLK